MISVIITTYKREANIVERAIKTVRNQTYQDWELLIIDDSPESFLNRDKVKKLVLEYCENDNRISYIAHEKNMGACAARNTGLRLAKGEYIAYLDDDDEWGNKKLELQYEQFLSSDSNLALVYCGCIFYDETKKTIENQNTHYANGNVFDELIVKNFIGGTSFPLMKTSCLRKIGGFDEGLESSQDFDVWLRIAKKYSIDYVKLPLVIYHIHSGEQISTSPSKRISGVKRRIEKNMDYFSIHRQKYSICLFDLAYAYATNRELLMGIKTWIKSVVNYPSNILFNIKGILRIIKYYMNSRK